jgi:hypothetical protein
MKIISLVGLLALSSCATSPTVTFWTKKGDTTLVHHLNGNIDRIEKLSPELSDVENIPDGLKGYQVVESKADVLPKAKPSPSPSPKKAKKDKDSGSSRLADEIHELRGQVKSLKDQISAIPQPTPAEQPVQQEAAAQPPRMSQ